MRRCVFCIFYKSKKSRCFQKNITNNFERFSTTFEISAFQNPGFWNLEKILEASRNWKKILILPKFRNWVSDASEVFRSLKKFQKFLTTSGTSEFQNPSFKNLGKIPEASRNFLKESELSETQIDHLNYSKTPIFQFCRCSKSKERLNKSTTPVILSKSKSEKLRRTRRCRRSRDLMDTRQPDKTEGTKQPEDRHSCSRKLLSRMVSFGNFFSLKKFFLGFKKAWKNFLKGSEIENFFRESKEFSWFSEALYFFFFLKNSEFPTQFWSLKKLIFSSFQNFSEISGTWIFNL